MFLLKNNKFNFKMTVVGLVLVSTVIFFIPLISSAQILVPQVSSLGTADLETLVGTIIQIFLGFLGLIALVIILYAGFIWMTSGGNEEKISKAKKILSAGVIGLIIILTSYVIASFILESVQNATHNNPSNGGRVSFGDGFGSRALGGGVIEYHYPERDARNIPRNTLIMMTFKIKVATSSIINMDIDGSPGNYFAADTAGHSLCDNYTASGTNGNECGPLSDYLTIINDVNGINGGEDISDNVVAVLQADGKNILLRPINSLGNSENPTYTRVILSSAMISAEGDDLFGINGYIWQFEVSTFEDKTPPTIDFVWPVENASNISRNAIIQMNFSEPINILSANQDNVTTTAQSGTLITGSLKISNQYRTVEFLSNMPCGAGVELNSCGEEVFCLPGDDDITTTIFSGDVTDPLSGISDAAGNMFDGNEDNDIPNDDYEWTFTTNNEVYLDPPHIVSVEPNNNEENVQPMPDPRVSALFSLRTSPPVDGNISPSSLTTDVFYIYDNTICVDLAEEDTDLNRGYKNNIAERDNSLENDDCFPSYTTYMSEDNKRCNIKIYYNLKNNTNYFPRIISELKDSYGNCFHPAEDQYYNSGQQ